MWRRAQLQDRRGYSEYREAKEKNPVHHHGSELPVRHHIRVFIVLPHLRRYDTDLLQDLPQFRVCVHVWCTLWGWHPPSGH
ncbi:hypothetical protein JTE90_015767 [Oedothorax gibbosus]|uniref:Uncharacterized protein n=1 Tax=Oedothorax gibbosus TaxID=931172 RepID=A0AAV6VV79_9ARAC|nr:hypothetical protein JTE90_015767 [Oedothorax gibbosus]